ncbi:MAG: MFS transporter [Sedimenticola sp.]
MQRNQLNFIFLNAGHFLDHFFMLIFASVAALRLSEEWGMSYSELIPYATPGFIAFGACALVAGWIADRWSRHGMLVIFFLGIGISSVISGLANSPIQMAIGLLLIGIFASIYHPVGLAMVVNGQKKTGTLLAINGVFGNMGVASAALVTGVLIDTYGWASAFYIPGTVSIIIGILYLLFIRFESRQESSQGKHESNIKPVDNQVSKRTLIHVFGIIFFTTAIGGLIFQSTTFSLPKVFAEAMGGSASSIGWYSFLVFSVAALAQLVVGHLLDNHSVRSVFAVIAAMQTLLFIVMTQTSGFTSLYVAIGFMLFVFGQIPINDVLVARLVKSKWRSRAYAVRYIVTFSVMALAVPFIAWIHGEWGFNILFAVLAFSALMIFAATLLLPANNRGVTHAGAA